MKVRIFERDNSLRQLLELVCQWVSNEVEVAGFPEYCPSYNAGNSTRECCSSPDSVLIIDAHLHPLSGLDWVEAQARGHCRVLGENKLILATNWTSAEMARAEQLGCKVMRKPFSTDELRAWLEQRLKQ